MRELEKILEEIDIKISGSMGRKREGLLEARDIIRKHMNDGWIPVEERLPEDDRYILLSFDNFSLPNIGRYEQDTDGGGNFYIGDEDIPCITMDLYVNAWRHMPAPYREE